MHASSGWCCKFNTRTNPECEEQRNMLLDAFQYNRRTFTDYGSSAGIVRDAMRCARCSPIQFVALREPHNYCVLCFFLMRNHDMRSSSALQRSKALLEFLFETSTPQPCTALLNSHFWGKRTGELNLTTMAVRCQPSRRTLGQYCQLSLTFWYFGDININHTIVKDCVPCVYVHLWSGG